MPKEKSQDAPVEEVETLDPQPQDDTPEAPEIPDNTQDAPESIDLEKIRAEISSEYENRLNKKLEESRRETVEKFSKVFGLSEADGDDEKPVYEEGTDINEYVEKVMDWRERERSKQESLAEKQEAELQQKRQDELHAATMAGWSKQLSEMERKGIIPSIENQQDENDPGVKARVNILNSVSEYNKLREAAGDEKTLNLWEVYYNYTSQKESSGADAPVFGNEPGANSGSSEDFYYEDIRKARSARELL